MAESPAEIQHCLPLFPSISQRIWEVESTRTHSQNGKEKQQSHTAVQKFYCRESTWCIKYPNVTHGSISVFLPSLISRDLTQARGELVNSRSFCLAYGGGICCCKLGAVGFSALTAYSWVTRKILQPAADFAFVTKCRQKAVFFPSQSGLDERLVIHPPSAGHSLAPCQVSLMLHFDK